MAKFQTRRHKEREDNRNGNQQSRQGETSRNQSWNTNHNQNHDSTGISMNQNQDGGWRNGTGYQQFQASSHHSATYPDTHSAYGHGQIDGYGNHYAYGQGYSYGNQYQNQPGGGYDTSSSIPYQNHQYPPQDYYSPPVHYDQQYPNYQTNQRSHQSWTNPNPSFYSHPSTSTSSSQHYHSTNSYQSQQQQRSFNSYPNYQRNSDPYSSRGSGNRWSGIYDRPNEEDSSSIPTGPRASFNSSNLPSKPSFESDSSSSKLPKKDPVTGRKLSKKERGFVGTDVNDEREISNSNDWNISTSKSYPDLSNENSSSPYRSHHKTWSNSRLGRNPSDSFSNSFSSSTSSSFHASVREPSQRYLEEVSIPSKLKKNQLSFQAPLLILDLNGTLLFRKKSSGGGATSTSSTKPELRPFLKTFLNYCLGYGSNKDAISNEKGKGKSKLEAEEMKTDEAGDHGSLQLPHGTHFWSKEKKLREASRIKNGTIDSTEDQHQDPDEKVRYQVLIWSSAQPQNVDSMVRAIFNPLSDESTNANKDTIPQLLDSDPEMEGPSISSFLRVYARDTLVDRSKYYHKSPSIKDLDIIWKVLNEGDESELMADDRKYLSRPRGNQNQNHEDPRREGNHIRWDREGDSPSLSNHESIKEVEKKARFGSNNTILLDDSRDKARMQPFNHLYLHEFDGEMANQVKRFRQYFDSYQNKKNSKIQSTDDVEEEIEDQDEEKFNFLQVDTTLIKVIGILEHARYQTNFCNWIKERGLGSFGSMEKSPPLSEESWGLVWERLLEDEGITIQEKEKEKKKGKGKGKGKGKKLELRLNQGKASRDDAFWLEEGLLTLKKFGIKLKC